MKLILLFLLITLSFSCFSQYKSDDSDATYLAKGYVQFKGDRFSPELDALTNSIINSNCKKLVSKLDTVKKSFSISITVTEYRLSATLYEHIPYERYKYTEYSLKKKDGHSIDGYYFSDGSLRNITVYKIDSILMSEYYINKNNCKK